MQPRPQRSDRRSTICPRTCSGDMYAGVPETSRVGPAPSTSSSAPTPPAPAASPSLVPPRLIEEAAAEYPPQALKDRREAIVLLDLEIDASGTVTQATVVREGDAEFDAAAIDAAAAGGGSRRRAPDRGRDLPAHDRHPARRSARGRGAAHPTAGPSGDHRGAAAAARSALTATAR